MIYIRVHKQSQLLYYISIVSAIVLSFYCFSYCTTFPLSQLLYCPSIVSAIVLLLSLCRHYTVIVKHLHSSVLHSHCIVLLWSFFYIVTVALWLKAVFHLGHSRHC